MDETLLICSANSNILDAAARQAGVSDFHIKNKNTLPLVKDFESEFPEILLLDFELISNSNTSFLEEVFGKVPLMRVYVLADSTIPEETLFPLLKSGGRGWIFHERGQFDLHDLATIVEQGYFLKPFIAEQIIQEFRKTSEGETLGAIEEEILRSSALGITSNQLEQNLNFQPKMLSRHWESIWRKLNINARARHELNDSSESRLLVAPPAHEAAQATNADAAGKNLHLVGFRVGGEAFAFEINDLQEIQRMLPITPLPKVPSYFLGIANLRGTILPVVDLRLKLELQVLPLTKDARIIVVDVNGKRIGILVDEVTEVLRANEHDVKAPPALAVSPQDSAIKGVLNISGRLILLLDLRALLGTESSISNRPREAVIG